MKDHLVNQLFRMYWGDIADLCYRARPTLRLHQREIVTGLGAAFEGLIMVQSYRFQLQPMALGQERRSLPQS